MFASVGWTALSAAFGLYEQLSSGVAGALGGVLLLVTWLISPAFWYSRVRRSTSFSPGVVRTPRLPRRRRSPTTETGRYNTRGADVTSGR